MTSLSLLSAAAAGFWAAPLPRPAPAPPRPRPPLFLALAGLALATGFLFLVLVIDLRALSYFLKPAELLYSARSFSYCALSSSALLSYCFLSSVDRLLHIVVSCFAMSPTFPDEKEDLFSWTKMKYALGGLFGSVGPPEPPKKRSLAFFMRFFRSATALSLKYFLPSALFVNSFMSFSYCAFFSAASSMYFFWPSAPSSRHCSCILGRLEVPLPVFSAPT
mmetsp:Transcript_56350/g.158837  ORF Transcript_56350/g.158837 Transcript_56350/m.158837 type:complete len:220 (-) Transcript_56350:2938-3597(-)